MGDDDDLPDLGTSTLVTAASARPVGVSLALAWKRPSTTGPLAPVVTGPEKLASWGLAG